MKIVTRSGVIALSSHFCVQFGSAGPMAITLCQSLGQNLGMLKKKERSSAGKKKKKTTPHTPKELRRYFFHL